MSFRTQFQGCSVKFSPFRENLLAVCTSQNFGIVGNGRQHVLQLTPQGIREVVAFDTLDGLYDCAWSESNENIIVSASGDGTLRAWDISAPPQANPIRSYAEHTHEVHSVTWNPLRRDCFVSTSWDDTAKVWSPDAPVSIRTFREHSYCVYTAAWCPTEADVLITASGDCTCKVFDVRQPVSSMTIKPHDFEVLAVDWNKYDENIVATGSVDKTIRTWDLRRPQSPLCVFAAHAYAVRRLVFSPFSAGLLAACSYDMSVTLWDIGKPGTPPLQRWGHHTEFAVGLDFSALVDGLIASSGWDGLTYVWHVQGQPGVLPPLPQR